MECDVVRDLIPLYLDGCASEGSRRVVEAHTAGCSGCRACLEQAGRPLPEAEPFPVRRPGQVSAWRASVLQSVLFFVYFGILTVGVAKEAGTPMGPDNGFWACAVVVPAAGFLLSLANWYFVRLYHSCRSFVLGSVLWTAAAIGGCFGWAMVHYGRFLLPAQGAVFAALELVLSAVLAWRYAVLLGKE